MKPEQHLSEMQAIYRFAEVTREQLLGSRKKEMAERKKRNLKHIVRCARQQAHKFNGKGTLQETSGDSDEGSNNTSFHLLHGSFPSCLRHGISTFFSICRGSPGLSLFPPDSHLSSPLNKSPYPVSLRAGWDLPSSKKEHTVQADCSCKAGTGAAAEDAHTHKHPQTHRSPDCPPKKTGWAGGMSSLHSWEQLGSPLAQTKLPSACQLRQLFGS